MHESGQPYGNFDPNGYNMNSFYGYEKRKNELFIQRKNEKKELRKLSSLAGGAFLCYMLIQNVLVFILKPFGIIDLYTNNPTVATCIDTIFSVVSILVPFVLFGTLMKKISKNENCYNFVTPYSKGDTLLAIVAGVGVCMLANIATSFFTIFMGIFGLKLTSPDISMPEGVTGVAVNIIRTIIVAAFVEEISLRGAVMGNLRQYGDKFAILASAVVFGLMHGNLIQAPFALIAGCAIGYLAIKCGSLWVAVAIHAINNGLSLFISYAIDIMDENSALLMQLAIIYGLSLVGVICLVIFNKRNIHRQLMQNTTALSLKEMAAAYITTPTMLVSLVFILYITSNYVQFGG